MNDSPVLQCRLAVARSPVVLTTDFREREKGLSDQGESSGVDIKKSSDLHFDISSDVYTGQGKQWKEEYF
ncbi:MAG: hypothetical protein AB2551_06230 [Candidatus Thiodiazotropha sp.]